MRTAEQLLAEAQDIMARWLEPHGLSDRAALDQLLEVLDGPDAVGLAIADGRIPAESPHQIEVMQFLRRKSLARQELAHFRMAPLNREKPRG